ncbi:MAG: alcohol dehydrogenase catalytic domain-containing protein [Myxococcales bacterium]|nr:alcohol dehydrogenase catalytic domain-containing protein [Myxococcales bacterium]
MPNPATVEAVVLHAADGSLRLAVEVEVEVEVDLEVEACGVCLADLHILDSELDGGLQAPALPPIPGHRIVAQGPCDLRHGRFEGAAVVCAPG